MISEIVAAIAPRRDDLMLEIGPGLGALTCALLPHLDHLHAVELDRDLIAKLEQIGHSLGKLTIYHADALSFSLSTLTTLPKTLRIVGNLPYNISTPLIFHCLQEVDLIQDMNFMLQKEVVDRLAANPSDSSYGRLSVMVQYHCTVDSLFDVGPEAFSPPPRVNSAIVRLVPHVTLPAIAKDLDVLSRLVAAAFGQRRKTLHNSLKAWNLDWDRLEVNPQNRAENLTVADFVRLANSVKID